jgi:hypothetical protein
MSVIEVKCLQCGKSFKVKSEFAGKKGKCAVCGKIITIPDPSKKADQLGLGVDMSDSERKKVSEMVARTPGSYVTRKKRGFFARLFGRK